MPRIRAENIAAHKELTRRQILDVAVDLFVADGYAETALADIAADVGVGRTTLYEYFRDKEEILMALVEETFPELIDGIIGAIPDGTSHRERLGELVVASLLFVSDPSNVGTMVMRELPRLSEAAQARVRSSHQRLEREIVAECAAGVAAGEFRDMDPRWVGRIAGEMAMSAARTLLRDADPKQRVHEVADSLLAMLFDGLAAS
jgi:AcrR family transcriptional regulator